MQVLAGVRSGAVAGGRVPAEERPGVWCGAWVLTGGEVEGA